MLWQKEKINRCIHNGINQCLLYFSCLASTTPSVGQCIQFWFSFLEEECWKIRECKTLKQNVPVVGENALHWEALRAQAVKSYLKGLRGDLIVVYKNIPGGKYRILKGSLIC